MTDLRPLQMTIEGVAMLGEMSVNPPAFLTALVREYDQWYLRTTPVVPQSNGELFSITGSQFGESLKVRQLSDLRVSAYVGSHGSFSEPEGDVWGFRSEFKPYSVDEPGHARSMAATLTKLNKGLAELSESAGYIRTGDYAAYAYRVASVLGVKTHYWLHGRDRFMADGERYRKIQSIGALSYEMDRAVRAVKEGKGATYYR